MAREFSKAFYNSKQWKLCRESFISYRITIDGGMCEKCKNELGYEVHHKIYLTPENISDPMITLAWDNLQYLCSSCHSHVHMGELLPTRKGLVFNKYGELIEKRDIGKYECE